MWMIKKLNHSGDTIIEVILAVTVACFVLTAAVVSTDSNLNIERQSENRSIAVQIVESQVESLDAYYNSSNRQSFINYLVATDGATFCMNPSGPVTVPSVAPSTNTSCTFSLSDQYLATPAEIAAAGGIVFTTTISFDSSYASTDGLYQATVAAAWTQTGLGHPDNVTVNYRLN
jgi:Tfp pilus assembly protein PilV